ncbi:MAG TPA: hypothetical protein VFS15_05580, partial [Kofleriaceae bacterium]|nr:hypothetical protein [Kofleriaceae bacterium]
IGSAAGAVAGLSDPIAIADLSDPMEAIGGVADPEPELGCDSRFAEHAAVITHASSKQRTIIEYFLPRRVRAYADADARLPPRNVRSVRRLATRVS